ncbi:chloride channel CLIC-like protein 1 [Notolabrus celidotus]|uniref:chloride channel CLIC-like protein 1 n=1 Tax=Notolabrus celidotus TaxID=1203425 RepID=UPI001490743E|nr:chloride channel CLIC-like protein 1 [Notolabrus celidotus]
MLLIVLVLSLALSAAGQHVEDDWIDPYDMLNYDASTKTMRKPAEPANYPNVPTKRREYNEDSNQAEQMQCDTQVKELQSQVNDLQKKITLISQQPTCNPVFKRFLSRLLKEIQRVGMPSDSVDVFYDAKIKLSSQAMTEIQKLLEGEDTWRTGALDNAISQVLVDLKPHEYEAWKWRFEDTFSVELDTLLKMGLLFLVLIGIICTQLWSTVSRFMQFRRMLFVGFIVSIVWNWFYLYKTEFAKHQNNLVKSNSNYEKCTGIKSVDWTDSIKEWYRSTWTLQDDPCKKYYEVLIVDPFWLVPPTKAFAVTITTFFTEPLKHIGEGISEFLRALLKDLPITLQLPVLLTIVLAIVVFMYGGVNAAFQHGITAPFRRSRRDPPPPQLGPRRHVQEIEDADHLAEGDAPQQALRHQAHDARLHRNQVNQRRPNRPREQRAEVLVETLHTAGLSDSEDETDAGLREEEQNLSTEPDSDTQQEAHEEMVERTSDSKVSADKNKSNTKPTKSPSSQSKNKPLKRGERPAHDESSRDSAASRPQPEERRPSHNDFQDQQAEDKTPSVSRTHVETVGVPVQESSSTLAD